MSESPQAAWGLDPRYAPADKDSGLVFRFIGNTSRLADVSFIGQVDAGQMRYLSGWLKRQANKLEEMGEVRGAKDHIVTPRDIPPAAADLASLLPPGLRGR